MTGWWEERAALAGKVELAVRPLDNLAMIMVPALAVRRPPVAIPIAVPAGRAAHPREAVLDLSQVPRPRPCAKPWMPKPLPTT